MPEDGEGTGIALALEPAEREAAHLASATPELSDVPYPVSMEPNFDAEFHSH